MMLELILRNTLVIVSQKTVSADWLMDEQEDGQKVIRVGLPRFPRK